MGEPRSPGIDTMSSPRASTTKDARKYRRCSIQRLVASFVTRKLRFTRSASSKCRWKWPSRPKARMVVAPERHSSKELKRGLFDIRKRRIASRFVRLWTSLRPKKHSARTAIAGPANGLTMTAKASMSAFVHAEMQVTSSCSGAVKSTSIWSSPSLFMMRPDGVVSKKLVVQPRTLLSNCVWMRPAARMVARTHRPRERRVSRTPPKPIASHMPRYHSWLRSRRSSCQATRKRSGAISPRLKTQQESWRHAKTWTPPSAPK
mmetsp:Transcript_25960/g.77537  ORF Transcript_25960/g.77537 Transcript_25960/m.77537 type:complete len:261 (-) Transcript_25960:569-1351(-)